MGFVDSAITAVLGYVVDFIGLIMLMAVIILMGKLMLKKKAAPAAAPQTAAPAAAEAPKKELPLAPGSAGKVAIYDVPDKEAAMIMAIVADKMQKPLNELRFKSIKEVK